MNTARQTSLRTLIKKWTSTSTEEKDLVFPDDDTVSFTQILFGRGDSPPMDIHQCVNLFRHISQHMKTQSKARFEILECALLDVVRYMEERGILFSLPPNLPATICCGSIPVLRKILSYHKDNPIYRPVKKPRLSSRKLKDIEQCVSRSYFRDAVEELIQFDLISDPDEVLEGFILDDANKHVVGSFLRAYQPELRNLPDFAIHAYMEGAFEVATRLCNTPGCYFNIHGVDAIGAIIGCLNHCSDEKWSKEEFEKGASYFIGADGDDDEWAYIVWEYVAATKGTARLDALLEMTRSLVSPAQWAKIHAIAVRKEDHTKAQWIKDNNLLVGTEQQEEVPNVINAMYLKALREKFYRL